MHAIRGLVLLAVTVFAAQAFGQGKAYVGNFKDDTVSVIDLRGGSVTKTVPVEEEVTAALLTQLVHECGVGKRH